MKLLNYYYYFIRVSDKLHAPNKDEYLSALKTVAFPISIVLGALVFNMLFFSGLFEVIKEHWPYDYGRQHSKNFFAPTAILALLIYIATRILLKKYFYREGFQVSLDAYFGKEASTEKVHDLLPDVFTFFLVLFAVFLGIGFVPGISSCLLVIACLEIWVRKRFG